MALPLILLPILTYYLSPKDYGIIAIYQVILSFAYPLIQASTPINITKNYKKLNKTDLAELLGNMFIILCICLCIFSFLFIFTASYSYLLGIPKLFFLFIPILSFCNSISTFNLTLLRNQDKPKKYGLFEISANAINLTVSLFLIINIGLGWQGRAIGIITSSIFMGIVSFIALYHTNHFIFSINKKKIKEVLTISLPLIPHSIGGIIITMSDRIFINQMVDTSAVGLYSVGYSFGMVINLLVNSFNKVWSPYLFRELSEVTHKKKSEIVKYTYFYFILISVAAMVLSIVSIFILPYIVSQEFTGASRFIIWIAMGYAFRGMYTMVFPYLVHRNKTKFLGILTPAAAIINLSLNCLLIRINGPVGAAQATLIAYFFIFAATWIYSMKIYKMPWFDYFFKRTD